MRYEKADLHQPPKHQKPEIQPYSPSSPAGVTHKLFFEPHPFQLMCRAVVAACGSCSVPFHPFTDCRTRGFGSPACVRAR